MNQKNLTKSVGLVSRRDREGKNRHRGCVVWFTGLSASGKSTLAIEIEHKLFERGCQAYILDGDNVRHGLNRDLGFSPADRTENIRRIGEVANLFADAGVIVLTAFISPYRQDRDTARKIVESGQAGGFIEVFVDCPLEICERRDPKGLYKKARSGELKEFTGISAPYEPPANPELHLQTGERSPAELSEEIVRFLEQKRIL